ncbi:hypothetical protein KJ840_01440 [Patescibacteria group bacterium]|nr:hypothetical protein [Patescibacteria group bacterium]
MKKVYKILLIVLVILIVVFITFIVYFNFLYEPKFIDQDSPVEFITYRNERLGFELKYPNKTYYSLAIFELEEGGYDVKGGFVLLKVFEFDDYIYFDDEYSINCNGSYKINEDVRYEMCRKEINNMDSVEDWRVWRINIVEINNEEELDLYIKENFGSSCYAGERNPYIQEGVEQIKIYGDGLDLDHTLCPLNGGYEMFYYPEKSKLIEWNTGMERIFWGNKEGTVTFDEEMIESFRFID